MHHKEAEKPRKDWEAEQKRAAEKGVQKRGTEPLGTYLKYEKKNICRLELG